MRPSFRISAICATLLSLASVAPAAAQAPSGRVCDEAALRAHLAAEPRRAATAHGRISVLVPEGMRVFAQNELPSSLRTRLPGELLAIGNDFGPAIVIVLLDRARSTDDPALREFMLQNVRTRAPGLEPTSEIVERDGARWLRVEAERNRPAANPSPVDEDYVAFVQAPFQGGGVLATFISSHVMSAVAKVRASFESLEIEDCQLPRDRG